MHANAYAMLRHWPAHYLVQSSLKVVLAYHSLDGATVM